jgi:hypothetical protein
LVLSHLFLHILYGTSSRFGGVAILF